MARPRNDPEDKPRQITVRLPPDLATRLQRLADNRIVPPAILVRQLVKERLDELEQRERKGRSE